MRKVVIGITVTLALAGMLAGNAEAAPLRGCCIVAGYWMCGMACWGQHQSAPPPLRNPARPASGCCKQYGRWQCPCPH
jgi:hypothetical protein